MKLSISLSMSLLIGLLLPSSAALAQQRLRALTDAPCEPAQLTSQQGTLSAVTGRHPLQLTVQNDQGLLTWQLAEPIPAQSLRLHSAPFPGSSDDFVKRLEQSRQSHLVIWWCRDKPNDIIVDLYP